MVSARYFYALNTYGAILYFYKIKKFWCRLNFTANKNMKKLGFLK
jgi:hypothetical protein